MKSTYVHSHEEAFARLQKNLSAWSLPSELLESLRDCHIAVPFEKGAIVFEEGSTDDLIACVLNGYIRVNCTVGDGNRTVIRLAGPGELIGHSDHVDSNGRRKRLFESQAFGKCTVALISRDHVARLLHQLDTDLLMQIVESLNSFWSLNVRWFATLLGLPFGSRLELVMSDLALRAGVKDARGTILIPELAHEDLAEMIGSSRPMVSRLISQMIGTGLIERRAKQYVLLKSWDFEPYLPLLRAGRAKDVVHSNVNGTRPEITYPVTTVSGSRRSSRSVTELEPKVSIN
jgi:CRP/FNR family transcriptional regulator, cyclic AMP receptor protein